MLKQNAILQFDRNLVDKPIISVMIRSHDVSVNILQASITPEEAGNMFVQLEGEVDNVKKALEYLDEMGVRLILPAKNLAWDEDKCTHCGVCVGQCLPSALRVDPSSGRLSLDHGSCLACELCIPACPFGALASVSEIVEAHGPGGTP